MNIQFNSHLHTDSSPPHTQNAEQQTPLHVACRCDRLLTVLALLLAGANPGAVTEEGELPEQLTDSRLIGLFLQVCVRVWMCVIGRFLRVSVYLCV